MRGMLKGLGDPFTRFLTPQACCLLLLLLLLLMLLLLLIFAGIRVVSRALLPDSRHARP